MSGVFAKIGDGAQFAHCKFLAQRAKSISNQEPEAASTIPLRIPKPSSAAFPQKMFRWPIGVLESWVFGRSVANMRRWLSTFVLGCLGRPPGAGCRQGFLGCGNGSGAGWPIYQAVSAINGGDGRARHSANPRSGGEASQGNAAEGGALRECQILRCSRDVSPMWLDSWPLSSPTCLRNFQRQRRPRRRRPTRRRRWRPTRRR